MKRVDFHPLLLALFPIFSLFVHNRGQISAEQMLGPIVAVAILTALFWGLAYLLVKDGPKSAILTSLFLILFFSFGHTMNMFLIMLSSMGQVDTANFFIQSKASQTMAVLLWFGLLVLVSYLVRKSRYDLRPLSQFLNVFSLVLVAIVAFTWIAWRVQEANAYSYIDMWHRSVRSLESVPRTKTIPADRPNIYYIILDEYAREDVLAETFDLDNSAFYAYLTAKGFCIAQQSTSNYSQSELSFASALNSIYLENVANTVGHQSTNRLPLEAMVSDNRLFQRLRAEGYTIMAFATGYSFSELRTADIFKSPPTGLTGFESEMLHATPIPVLLELPFLRDEYDLQRERILYTFDHLTDANQLPSPVFVFAHIPAPHTPFLFGAQGEPLNPKRQISAAGGIEFTVSLTPQEYVDSYRKQLIFVTTRLQSALDTILSNSHGSTIIILQSDHGSSARQLSPNDEIAIHIERMATFSAFYLPDGNYDKLCPRVTPVNIFRIIMNRYLGTNFELLEDKNYFSTYAYPYTFIDVTDHVSPPNP